MSYSIYYKYCGEYHRIASK